jgi:hypothetical protein
MSNLVSIDQFQRPVPGQALTVAPGSLPYERPPEMANVDDALDFLFKRITDERAIYSLLGLMESGMPVSTLVQILLQTGFTEGKWTAPMTHVMAPAVGVMLIRIADAAKISYKLTPKDGQPKPVNEVLLNLANIRVSELEVQKGKKAAEMTARDAKGLRGLMAPG